ncbi:YhzD family protein [Psychrobacillus antarcticus]|uniref:YhzD family protein n=1 Tax=Psychrobacillus antarcticus TaxID=2879115 RepID=UPI00240888FA|nr:YhzD family protein [Psychrobacillus antarcticus]
MKPYRFTAFESTGELILEETWKYENDEEAKQKGEAVIEEKGFANKTHRLVNSSGKLVLFHV